MRETGALVVCDEAYQEFGGPSAIPLLGRSSRLVVLRTFSKAMGMAGLRFGSRWRIRRWRAELAKGKLPYNVNARDAGGGHGRCCARRRCCAERTRRIVATRERFVPRLAALPGITVFPTAANFVLIRCLARPAREVFRRLYDELRHPGPRRLQCRRAGGVPAHLDRHATTTWTP